MNNAIVSSKISAMLMLLLLSIGMCYGATMVFDPNIKSLNVVAGQNWLSPPVITLGSGDRIHISFDELSHDYHRYIYHIEHCEADWSVSESLFQSDYLDGLNDNVIEDYVHSINTTVSYTHYSLSLPNSQCRLKLSGNYRLTVIDDDSGEAVLQAEFMVVEPLMNWSLEATSNTDIDTNKEHQQLQASLNFGNIMVSDHERQLYTVFMQNNRNHSIRTNIRPDIITNKGLAWTHSRPLIFDAGNEYHKFEILSTSHPTMGIDHVEWDGNYFNAYPFANEVSKNYLYDEDANGSFFIRNSDNTEIDYTCDYVMVHFRLDAPYSPDTIRISGAWTTDQQHSNYDMVYSEDDHAYFSTVILKQGYYSYQYTISDASGQRIHPYEGSYYQTENSYQAYAYYKADGDRTWRLLAYRTISFPSSPYKP